MTERTTYSSSSGVFTGADMVDQYAARFKTLFDASALPLTSVAGTGNAVTAVLDPPIAPSGMVDGMKFTLTWAAANTGAVTLSINGATAAAVVDADDLALTASALIAGRRSLLEWVGGKFRVLSGAGSSGVGAGPAYQAFTVSGTWTKPTGYDPDTVVVVELWGGGGGGGRGGSGSTGFGGGGGGYAARRFRIADLPSSVSVTIGAGGAGAATVATNGTAGGNTTFGSLMTAFRGGAGSFPVGIGGGGNGGGGGGSAEPGANGNPSGAGGAIGGGSGSASPNATSDFGGGGGGVSAGGIATYGGGGGSPSTGTAGGVSVYGGNGGGPSAAGQAPGGGGGGGNASAAGAGARGECRVWIYG